MRVWLDGSFYRIPAAVSRGDLLVTDRGVLRCQDILHAVSGAVAILVQSVSDPWWSMETQPIVLQPET